MPDLFEVGRTIGSIQSAQVRLMEDVAEMRREIKTVDRRLRKIEGSYVQIPRAEAIIKTSATIALPLGALLLTGSWERAVEVLKIMVGEH